MAVSSTKAKQVLTKLGFGVRGTAKQWQVTVPFWRRDVTIMEDVVEEVGRMVGYDKLPEELPPIATVPMPIPSLVRLKDEIRDVLVQLGFIEVVTQAFYGERWRTSVGGQHYAIANPLDATQHFLRRSLTPHLREVLERAADAGQDARVFEIGRVFFPEHGKRIEDHQPWKLAIGLAQKVQGQSPAERKLIGVAQSLGEALSVKGIKLGAMESYTAKGRAILVGEIDVAALRDLHQPKRFSPLPKFPTVGRDVSFLLTENVPYADIEQAVRNAGQPLLESVELFDVFTKGSHRSLAFHLTFRAPDRTLTDSEISAKMKAISEALRQLGAELR
jgi:phenylalanyl-tRNA synthetase beta chain